MRNGMLRLGAVLLILLLFSCSSAESANEVNGKEEVILAVGDEPDTGFDPTVGWGRYGSPLFQSTLLKRDNDLQITNDLATDYRVSDDGLVWTVELKEDILFSDGEPLTAEDVKFTFETAKKSGSVIDLTFLERVETKDENVILFYLNEPRSTFVNSLITLGIVPKHAYNEDYSENPIGSGPYQLVQWDKGQQMIITTNEHYYGKKPYFKQVTLLFLNEDAAFAAAKAGQVDMAYIPANFSKQSIEGMVLKEVPSVDNRGIMFPYVKSGSKTEEGYPIGNDVTADKAIRKAINVAIDRQALVDGVLEGRGTPAYSIADGLPWWNEETTIDDNDWERAEQILRNGGWEDKDGDGIVEKGSLKAEFNLLYTADDNIRQSLSIAAADMLKPLGIQINVEGKSWDEIKTEMHANAVMSGWGSHNPLEMYNVYSSHFAGVEWYNPGFYNNPKVDEYFSSALLATNEQEAIKYWKKAQWDGETGFSEKGDAPWAWLVNVNHLYLIDENLDIGEQRIQPHGHGWPITANIVDWKWNNETY